MSRVLGSAVLLVIAVAVNTANAASTIDAYRFDSPAEEARYRALIDELRCPQCLNTNLAGSDAPIAADLRHQVYLLIEQGASDHEIKAYLRERYGDFILYRPPFTARTAVVWLLPGLLFLIGAGVLLRVVRNPPAEPAGLSEAERRRLDRLRAEID